MTQVVGQLEIQLLSDLARLQTDMDKAKRAVGIAMSAIDRSVAEAAQSMVDYTTKSKMTTSEAISAAAKQSAIIKNAMAEQAHYDDLKTQWAAHNKKLADQEIADTKRRADALAAFHVEAQNAELNLIHTGRGKSSAMLTDKYQRLGFSQTEIDAQLSGLRKIEAANAAAFAAANPHITKLQKEAAAAGTSVKGLSASLRNVPAQFTDIFVSLQGGQAPLTVLLQQGGQLKDMFGGIGPAFRALGGYVLGLVNPFTVGAAVIGGIGYAAFRASEDTRLLNLSLIAAGKQGVASVSDLNAMAAGLVSVGVTGGAASAGLVTFIAAGAKVDEGLQAITKASIDLERYGGKSVEETAKKYVALAKDPLDGIEKLTLAQYQHIEALLKLGKRTEAVKEAQDALTISTREEAKARAASLGPLDTATDSWKRYAAAIWDAAKGLAASVIGSVSGRSETGGEERARLQKLRDRYAKEGYDTTKEDARLAYFKRIDDAEKQGIANLTKENELKNLLANFDKNDAGQRKLRERNTLIADNTKLLAAGLISQKQYNDALARLDTKPKGSKGGLSDAEKGLKIYNDLIAKTTGLNSDFTEKWNGLSAAMRGNKITVDELTQAQAKLLSEQTFSKDAAKAQEDALKAADKARQDSIDAIEKARNSSLLSHAKELESLDDKAQKLEDEVRMYGKSKAALEELTISRMQDRIEVLKGFDNSADEIARIEEVIAARRRLAAAGTVLDLKNVEAETKKQIEAASKSAAETMHNDVKGALSAAFRDTKDPITAFGDALGNIVFTRLSNAVAEAMATQLVGNGSAGSTGILSGLMSLFGFAKGGAFDYGVTPFANGGAFHNSILTQATPFRFASGGSFNHAVAGEAGPEAVMPLARGSDGRLGVRNMSEGGKSGDTFVININATVGDIASKTDVVNGMRTVAAQVQSAFMRSKTHGGALA